LRQKATYIKIVAPEDAQECMKKLWRCNLLDYNSLTILQNDIMITLLLKIADDNDVSFSEEFMKKLDKAKKAALNWPMCRNEK